MKLNGISVKEINGYYYTWCESSRSYHSIDDIHDNQRRPFCPECKLPILTSKGDPVFNKLQYSPN